MLICCKWIKKYNNKYYEKEIFLYNCTYISLEGWYCSSYKSTNWCSCKIRTHGVNFYIFSSITHFLYPGKSQIEPEWTVNPLPKSPNFLIYKLIDTINPFSWYRTAQAIIQQNPDCCIVKYWHPYFVPCFAFTAWILRRKNIPVICIIDNLFPHERHFGDTLLTRIFFTQITGAITQSEIVHKQFKSCFPYIPETMIPHPVYDQFWPPEWQKEAQKKLGIPSDKKVLLFLIY